MKKLDAIYGSSFNFLKIYNPDMQVLIMENENSVYSGKAANLAFVKKGYGGKIAESWIMAQLENLNNFCGVKEKVSTNQMLELSRFIIAEYGFLKVTELMLFFSKLKMGKYGKFYGVIDPIVITSALTEFNSERIDKIHKINEDAKEIELEKRRIFSETSTMTKDEYIELYWLFNMGYEKKIL